MSTLDTRMQLAVVNRPNATHCEMPAPEQQLGSEHERGRTLCLLRQ